MPCATGYLGQCQLFVIEKCQGDKKIGHNCWEKYANNTCLFTFCSKSQFRLAILVLHTEKTASSPLLLSELCVSRPLAIFHHRWGRRQYFYIIEFQRRLHVLLHTRSEEVRTNLLLRHRDQLRDSITISKTLMYTASQSQRICLPWTVTKQSPF